MSYFHFYLYPWTIINFRFLPVLKIFQHYQQVFFSFSSCLLVQQIDRLQRQVRLKFVAINVLQVKV